jgi:hypothetical protein
MFGRADGRPARLEEAKAMSRKFTPTTLLCLAVSGALVDAMVGCSDGASSGGEATALEVSADLSRSPPEPRSAVGVRDPGVRGGPPGAGGPIAGLDPNELALWNEGRFRTTEVEGTCDSCSDFPQGSVLPPDAPADSTNSAGLGGRFNSNTCTSGCHAQPAIGGTSPAINPSFAAASAKGAVNRVPFFETLDGPTREVRFLFNPDGSRDGSVHQKFTVAGRSDAPLGRSWTSATRRRQRTRIPRPRPRPRCRRLRLAVRHPGLRGVRDRPLLPGVDGVQRGPRVRAVRGERDRSPRRPVTRPRARLR